jgi:hypothetical protein
MVFQFGSTPDFNAAWVNAQIAGAQNYQATSLINQLLEDNEPGLAPGTNIDYNDMTECIWQIYSNIKEQAISANPENPIFPPNINQILTNTAYIGPLELWNYSYNAAFNGNPPLLPRVLVLNPDNGQVSRSIVIPS